MGFKGLQTFEERHAEHIRPEVLALARRPEPITLAEYEAGRWNSYEWHILAPRLNDEAFAQYAAHNIANCHRGDRSVPYAIYDDALVGFVAPELLRRWRATFADAAVKAESAVERFALPPSENARIALLAGGPLALAALLSDGPEAAQAVIDAQRARGAQKSEPTPPPDTLTLSRAEAERLLRVMGSSERQVSEGLCTLVERIEAFLYPKKEA